MRELRQQLCMQCRLSKGPMVQWQMHELAGVWLECVCTCYNNNSEVILRTVQLVVQLHVLHSAPAEGRQNRGKQ